MKSRGLTCQAAIVPGGLANPMVRRLGILSADRIPNVFLLRRDGSIAWCASGLPYGDAEKFVNLLAAKVHIESCEVETAYEALNRSDVEEAARIFGGPYLPWDPDRFGWRPPRYHGKALAYMAMKDWEAALESIEVAIEAQNLKYLPGRKRERAPNWRKDAAKVTVTNPDEILIELWTTKAEILAKLGRNDEAAQIRERYTKPTTEFPPGVYKSFHEKLKEWKTRNQIDKP
jgi:tetratricopeptide (TPR) repeat protein